MTCIVRASAETEDSQKLTQSDRQQWFTVLCGNDNFSEWFYSDIMRRCL